MQEKQIRQALEEIGFFSLEKNYDQFIEQGINYLLRPSVDGGFLEDSSCLNINTPTLKHNAKVLVIDIGGTHTKVGLASYKLDNPTDWQVLFDYDNNFFDFQSPDLPIVRFTKSLSNQLKKSLNDKKVDPAEIAAVGIIWSNALTVTRLPEDSFPRGTSALITGYSEGSAYRKGEFFTQELYDGFDLGSVFLAAMKNADINPKVFIIGNDTVFTLKACPNADAGMVASTGANATDIDEAGIIYNTEMGGIYDIRPEWLSSGDTAVQKLEDAQSNVRLEDLMAGKWLPRLFESHVVALFEHGITSLQNAARYFSKNVNGILKGSDLEKLLNNETANIFNVPECQSCLEELRELAAQLARRAGLVAAGMAYFSLYHQLQRKDTVILSLDSSQARHLNGYLEALETQLSKQLPAGKKIDVKLQHPDGVIAVPMRGLAGALIGELARLY